MRLPIVKVNVSVTLAPAKSVAITFRSNVPVSPAPGVPENSRVVGLKLNQVGRAEPSARVAT
ncbi:hypothetical protein D3C73_1404510 [compost metagenome]